MFVPEVQTMSTAQKTPTPLVARPNLRRSRRQPPKSTTKVHVYRNALGLGANIAVSILDLSEVGVRLVVKEPLAEGCEFALEFEPNGARPIKLTARVIWSLLLADGKTCVGAELSKKIPYPDLLAMART
jgi:hypothetical protein